MVCVLGGEQPLATAVEADPVQMLEVRVAAPLLPRAHEVDGARSLVHAHDLVHVAITARYAILQAAGGEIVEVQMDPVVPLRPPDQLV